MDDHSYVLTEFLNRNISIVLFLERVKEVQIVTCHILTDGKLKTYVAYAISIVASEFVENCLTMLLQVI